MRWLLAVLLALALPSQSVSSTIAGLLGPHHLHRTALLQSNAVDSMAGWQDFRRAHFGPGATLHAAAHAELHASGARHHHDLFDADIVMLESTGSHDGGVAELVVAAAGFIFVPATQIAAPTMLPVAATGAWRATPAASFSSADRRRIERPPQAIT